MWDKMVHNPGRYTLSQTEFVLAFKRGKFPQPRGANYIKSLHIEGFKKFVSLDVQFNERMNILVGENEAGKSTILNALKTVLNQQYRNTDKSVLRDLFNTQMVAVFKEKPSVKTLPRIYIEVELALDPQQKDASYFYGEVYGQRKQQFEKYKLYVAMTRSRGDLYLIKASTFKKLKDAYIAH